MSIRIAFVLSFISIVSSAQDYWQISGIVTNSETLKPLPYTNIRILNKSLGTISNQQGRFIIRLPVEFRSDTLTFSYLGFKKQILPLGQVTTDSIIISLQPEVYELKEVTAQGLTARSLLQKCLEQIPENYPDQPVGMTAFYRETIHENSLPIQGVEAVLGIDKLSLAIIRIDYRINPYHIKHTSVVDIYTESELNKLDIYTQTNSFDCSVNYRMHKDKWFLDYVRISYNFHLLWLNDQYLADINNTIQFVITDFNMDQLYSARYGKLIKRKFPIPQQLGEQDDSFWENYNYILREEIEK
ncbi:MAG: carboxypeptidase-like regulatory domain-containing protein [Bacteroidales bacterium]|nr:carboxypeptidase-like regulatory domain-containing protein [Bacteroidales bacterium]